MIAASAVALAALVVTGGVWYAIGNQELVPPILIGTPSNVTPPPKEDQLPIGCSGGDSRDAAMVLAAQAEAPRTGTGAVEFAASFGRWAEQYPVPAPGEALQLQAAVISPGSSYDLVSYLEGEPNLSDGLVPNGTEFHLSTVPGVWNLESYSYDGAVVSVGMGIVVGGALHSTFRVSSMYRLSWTDDGWTVEDAMQPRAAEQLFSMGTEFTEGC
ncbi:hypothetical protein [Agromyces archimandritae]|uniref:Uncharacterized protein n=1 Tax=Agromyces archimandritae TaxID=2781962 RepID=A0A975FQ21_9MICO|nr:hypothetical protein [Agromyces archimandritae]QTX05909.1 hypothetical protein G127AT_06880 [Agromyces archimandritae]